MKALVIAPQPFFSPRGTPFSVYYRTLVTAELGVSVDLLTYGQGQDVEIPGVRIRRIPNFGIRTRVKTGPSLLKLLLDVPLVLWMIGLLLRKRYDFVHAHEEAIFFCQLLKPIFRFQLVYDMHSSLPQQLSNFNFTKSGFLIGLFERLEDRALRVSDAVITICPALAEYALPRMPEARRHFLIENSIFDPIRLRGSDSRAPSAPRPLPEGRPLVLYAGTFEDYQGLEILIPAFAEVRERHPDAFLLMVGGTPEQVEAKEKLASQYGLEGHCLFTGMVEKALAKHYQEIATVQVSPRSEGTNTPLKVYEQLASGVPLVATSIPSHTQVLDESACILVDPEPSAMAEGILAALEDDALRARVVSGAARLYDAKYSRSVYESKMKQLMELLS